MDLFKYRIKSASIKKSIFLFIFALKNVKVIFHNKKRAYLKTKL